MSDRTVIEPETLTKSYFTSGPCLSAEHPCVARFYLVEMEASSYALLLILSLPRPFPSS